VLFSGLIAGTFAFGLFTLAVNSFDQASGQELLPEAGSNQTIGKPNTNVTITNDNNKDYPNEPNSLLDPFFGRD
jgi:hypothetical protein